MKNLAKNTFQLIAVMAIVVISGCDNNQKKQETQMRKDLSAKEILGNPNYPAISYGGYRQTTRDIQPTVDQLKEDLIILHAMGIRILRTYNVHLPHATNILKAIKELRAENKDFEMYVMLGAWIDCKNAWTDLPPDHNQESERNATEIAKAVELANEYPEIIKVLAVGNEAMVKWAAAYYVQPDVILKWVNHLQDLKKNEKLPKNLWITSSDDFSSWGGGSPEYHVEALNDLIKAVDYISMHTYPMHNTHYNPYFWGVDSSEFTLEKTEQINKSMERALEFAQVQYDSVKSYMNSLGVQKPVHIGETGWATVSTGHYGIHGSKATDEYKEALYYKMMREWTSDQNISCFYFEAFDEPWKDAHNTKGSENHFGLFTKDGQAKYALWDLVDSGTFKGLTRNGNPVTKTFDGKFDSLINEVLLPPALPQSLSITN